ncbi:putative UDP-rhamnose:rhamnosyltransferase 1, partial [Asparagus officinalis]|uniref:putative UDP-rhamnose:rhamnosyltransferase 1 n=1 Tax=Asparagus officinalis TaxID=4686 RepID=UPI00098E06A1
SVDRVKLGVEGSDAVAIRSCHEYEGEYLELLEGFYKKPVIPVGLLPPSPTGDLEDKEGGWRETFGWLDKQKARSVVFVSFGSEYKFSPHEVREIAHGLEMSDVPFLWALRWPSWLTGEISEALPEGFTDRINGRGIVEVGWAPQLEILAHESIGGSLFHCGLGSIVESLRHGHMPVLMPLIFDQGLNARFLAEKGVGIEVGRNEDGSFSRDEIAKCLRVAMVSDEGEALRAKAREMGAMVGDQALHDDYVKRFAEYLVCNAGNKV